MENKKAFFIGIDLGWREKRTTGICVLEGERVIFLEDVFGKELFEKITPYLKWAKVIAIDAPLTQGRGKGKMRLYEKFLSTKIFRQAKVTPIPPALIPKFCDFSRELVTKLERAGFVSDINLIEVFPALVKEVCKPSSLNLKKLKKINPKITENQESAFICAQTAFWHWQFKTRWLGYKDGFLFLPEISFWKKGWQKKFYQAWLGKDKLKYRYLITNIFD